MLVLDDGEVTDPQQRSRGWYLCGVQDTDVLTGGGVREIAPLELVAQVRGQRGAHDVHVSPQSPSRGVGAQPVQPLVFAGGAGCDLAVEVTLVVLFIGGDR